MSDQHSIDEDPVVLLTRENKAKVRVVLDQMHARASRPFGCEDCRHCGSDGDGYEYNGTWPICGRRNGLDESSDFPFKVAPSCFEISADGPVARLTYADYPDAPTGAFALSCATDAYGRISQQPIDDATFDELFEVLVEPIAWADEGEGYWYAEWRGMRGGASPADERVRKQIGYEDGYVAYVGTGGSDFYESNRKKPSIGGPENAKQHAEIQMRLRAIRLVVATGKAPAHTSAAPSAGITTGDAHGE